MPGAILIVDDEVQLVRHLADLLASEGFQAFSAHTAVEARAKMAEVYPDIVLLDLRLPDGDGAALLDEFRVAYPGVEFIIITAHGSIRSAVESTRRGASDYLTKPFDFDELVLAVQKALSRRTISDELRLLRSGGSPLKKPEPDESSYTSPAIRAVYQQAKRAASQDGIVLLLGESGTGKDHMASWIHRHSPRLDAPFFSINCAALPQELAESELFGHEPGAFTGTRGRKRGLVEMAERGTLLLNEIGELPLPLQAKLLTFLDTKKFMRVGGEAPQTVTTRIIAATNRDLQQEVAAGAFRADLYYRLNVFPIRLPALRERQEDIPVLAIGLLARLTADMGIVPVPAITKEAMDALSAHAWPGNIRELANVLERALIVSDGRDIEPGHLSITAEMANVAFQIVVRFPDGSDLHTVNKDVTRRLVNEALRRAGGNKQEAARLLGISRHALAYQMKAFDDDA